MVCRSPSDRKNASVGLKSEWSWNEKNLRLTFHSSVKLSIPRLTVWPRYARPDNCQSRNEKFSLRNEKFAFDFSYSWTFTFQPYRTYILLWGGKTDSFSSSEVEKLSMGSFSSSEVEKLSVYAYSRLDNSGLEIGIQRSLEGKGPD